MSALGALKKFVDGWRGGGAEEGNGLGWALRLATPASLVC